MLRRRQINSGAGAPRLRSTLATATGPVREAAWAVEERLVWGGADVLRGVFDAVKWPFQRLAWAVEQRVVWPIEELTGEWSAPLRAMGAAAVVLVAICAGVLGLALASNGGARTVAPTVTVQAIAPPPVAEPVPTAPASPVLQGAVPDFTPEADAGRSGASPPGGTAADTNLSTAAVVATPGPAALEVADRFAEAFVLYETGRGGAEVRAAFGETATPRLANALLRRPPRLPAGVEVPKAKVLNLVPGPRHGDTYTISVSLLRVGVTSELRIDLQRDPKSGDWRVTDVLG